MNKRCLFMATALALLALGVLPAQYAMAAGPPENSELPAIESITEGAPKVLTLEVSSVGTWKNEPTSYTRQWERCNTIGTECQAISGATGSFYQVKPVDHGHTLVIKVTAYNSYGQATASSLPSEVVTPVKMPEFIPAGGSYPVTFTFHGSFPRFEAASGLLVECRSMSGEGRIINPDEVANVNLTMEECNNFSFSCRTLEATGRKGFFGYINEAAKTVGLSLEGGNPFFQTFTCNGIPHEVRGSVIGQIGPVNKSTSSFELAYTESAGLNSPKQFAGISKEMHLEWDVSGYPFENWGIAGNNSFTTSPTGELRG